MPSASPPSPRSRPGRPDDVARIDGELNFKGRIEREDWIGQANALIAEDK